MKKTAIAIALAAASATAIPAYAEVEITGNVSLISDYRYRGLSQTLLKPALQGGFDLAHSSGFYLGNWNSNVSSTIFPGASLEMDVYGGYATELSSGINLDVGLLRYQYPGASSEVKPHTTEAYFSVGYGPISYKYSRSLTKFFGIDDSKGSTYNELNFEYGLNDKITLGAHAGMTKIKNLGSEGKYKDYSVSVSYALPNDYSIGLTYYSNSGLSADEKDGLTFEGRRTYKSAGVISLSKTF
jgi:uncharacterized protein (TIGR02001 family)